MPALEPKSRMSSTPLWLVLVTLLGGTFLTRRGKEPVVEKLEPRPAAVQAVIDADFSQAEDRMLAPLREFLALPPIPAKSDTSAITAESSTTQSTLTGSDETNQGDLTSDSATPRPKTAKEALAERVGTSVGLLEFLVVMVADPIETSTNYRFDLQIDALHKALGTEGYVPDHYYLPWSSQDVANAHRTEAGVLLYRRNGPSLSSCENLEGRTDLLMVYLIGETPTSGIHKEAFLAAVKQMTALGEMASCRSENSKSTIRVAGPLFTGAADSLAFAIRLAREEQLTEANFQVITGTAVSIDRKRFENLAGVGAGTFHSTVLYGNILRQALIDHVLDRTLSDNVRIAWLTETGTGYGSRISVSDGGRNDVVNRENNSNPLAPKITKQSRANIVEFRFPVNIARVRSGYAENRRRERSNSSILGPENSRLPIPFDDTSTARDVPPMQTPKVTAPIVELILSQILSTIRNEGIQYVGITSSDPRDPIFLAELIKQKCPDVQIMLVTSDLLHLHSEYQSLMHGTLVSSTHPLNPEAQDWCFPFGEENDGVSRHAVMSSQSNYGLYNAVLFLRGLERGTYMMNHDSTDGEANPALHNVLTLQHSAEAGWSSGLPLGYSMPFQSELLGTNKILRPPVWISRISPAGITPIMVHDSAASPSTDYTIGLKIAAPQVTNASPLPKLHLRSRLPTTFMIVSLLWLLASVLYFTAVQFPGRHLGWAKAFTTSPEQSGEFNSLIYVFRCYMTGSFLYMVALFGTMLAVYHSHVGLRGPIDFLTIVLCVFSYLVSAVLLVSLVSDWGFGFIELIKDFRVAMVQSKCLPASAALETNEPDKPHEPGKVPVEPELCWHLIALRAVGLVIVFMLGVILAWGVLLQLREWNSSPENAFFWFRVTSEMWNGLSLAITVQLLAVGSIILAYGILLQMLLMSPDRVIRKPDPSTSEFPNAEECMKRQSETRNSFLFPIFCRWQRRRPVLFVVLCVVAAIIWLGSLGAKMQNPDYFALPINFPLLLLLVLGGLWCVRLAKMIQVFRGMSRQLDEFVVSLRQRWPDSWTNIFKLLPDQRVSLKELFLTKCPKVSELEKAQREFSETVVAGEDLIRAEQKLCAWELELYCRQFFHHMFRLGLGLSITALLLFLCAQTFPFNQEPLLRLSASIMLASIGGVMAWYYLSFDRHELLSYLVGTEPKKISVNWSTVQMIAPAVLLTSVALLSQTFPDMWQWIRSVVEPIAISSP
jgi:hypothetical protein